MPGECAAVVKGDAYGCGIEQVTRGARRAGCKTFFVAQLSEARRVRAIAPEAAIYVLNGFSPGAAPGLRRDSRAAGDQQPGRARRVGPIRRDHGLARRRGAARRHRHEPARISASRRRRRSPPASSSENHGITLLMSHLACADSPSIRSTTSRSGSFAKSASLFRGISQLARQLLRHLPRRHRPIATWCGRASRSTAATRRRASPIRCGR